MFYICVSVNSCKHKSIYYLSGIDCNVLQMTLNMVFLMIPNGYTDFECEQYVDVHREFREVVC